MSDAGTPRIDVMLPFYGNVEHFKTAVQSVLAQDSADWRLVCVDDADPSFAGRDWLLSLNHPRVEYRRNAQNLGVAGNFAQCLSLVTAPYFVMMGADDLMLPGYLRTVAHAARAHPGVDVIQPGVVVIDEAGRPSRPLADRIKAVLRPRVRAQHVILSGSAMAESLVRADWAYFPSLLWKTRTAQPIGFGDTYDVALDLALLLDIALQGGSIVVGDEVAFAYRRHQASVSSATAASGERFDQERRFFRAYAARFREAGWKRAERIARRHVVSRLNALSVALGAVVSGRPADAWRLTRWALTG